MMNWRKPVAHVGKTAPKGAKRVLVIKLGALGDFVQALAAAKLIRDYHVGARITLLTTEPYKVLAERCPYFDVIEADGRPKEAQATAQLIARIRNAKYDMVYDLECSGRTANYYTAMRPWPPHWSGAAPRCSHPHANPDRDRLHPLDRYADQLRYAGIGPEEGYAPGHAPMPDLSWVRAAMRDAPRMQAEYFGIRGPYVMLLASAPGRPGEKGWSAKRIGELAKRIAAQGVTPVAIGATDEKDICQGIADAEPRAKNLVSRTDHFQLATLAERAAFVVGHDSGPMHIAAAAGAPCLTLFSGWVDVDRVTPRGRSGVAVIKAQPLEDLPAEQVDQAIRNLGAYRAVAKVT